MTQPTDQPATREPLDALIAEAFGARRTLPPHQRCEELNEQLRAAIDRLRQTALEVAGTLPEGCRDWHRIHNALFDAEAVLRAGMGSGYLSAAIHVGSLARVAQALRAVGAVGDR